MAFRIEQLADRDRPVVAFEGTLDEAALEALLARLTGAGAAGRLVLRRGTEAQPECLAALRALPGVEVIAESPYLSRWLRDDQPRGEPPCRSSPSPSSSPSTAPSTCSASPKASASPRWRR